MYTITTKEPVYVPCGSISSGQTQWVWSSLVGTLTGTKTGEKVDRYREKIAAGEPAGSPYSRDAYTLYLGRKLEDTVSLGRAGTQGVFMTSSFQGYPGGHWGTTLIPHLSVNMAEARSVALSKLYKKLESERSELNSYAVLAEFGDVIRQFGRPFQAIVAAFERHENRLYFERRRLVGRESWKREKFAKIAADTWLETSFGLIPLFADAESVANAFGRFEWEQDKDFSSKLRDRMRTRALVTNRTLTSYGATASQPFSYIDYFVEKETATVAMAQYVIGLEGEIRAEFGSNARLLELLGMEPRNLPLAVWEATPWSWLVDYWLNVQNILQAAATMTDRVKWIVLSETTRTAVTYRSKVRRLGTGTYFPLGFISNKRPSLKDGFGTPSGGIDALTSNKWPAVDAGDFRIVRSTFNRTLPGSLGVPPLYLKSPLGDMKKLANLGALVVSRAKEHKTWLS